MAIEFDYLVGSMYASTVLAALAYKIAPATHPFLIVISHLMPSNVYLSLSHLANPNPKRSFSA